LSAAVAALATPSAAPAQWPNTRNPYQDSPGMPFTGGIGPFGPQRPGIPRVPDVHGLPYAPAVPGSIIGVTRPPSFPGGGFDGDPFPGVPRPPTALDVINGRRNDALGIPRQGGFPPWNPGTPPPIPPAALNVDWSKVEVPKVEPRFSPIGPSKP